MRPGTLVVLSGSLGAAHGNALKQDVEGDWERGRGISDMTGGEGTSVEILAAAWRRHARILRGYGDETPAVALESCAEQLEAALRERDEATLSLTEAARESGYSADHLGRLVRDGKIPNAGTARSAQDRPPAPAPQGRSGLRHVWRLEPKLRELSTGQIVQSIIEKGRG